MKLIDLNKEQREELAAKVGSSEQYIYQLATRKREGSYKFLRKINKADSRFSLHELNPDIWPEPEGKS